MSDVTIRIYFQRGKDVEDAHQDFGLSDFAGSIPAIGDKILAPGVLQGLDRFNSENRIIWTVKGRIFNPRDLKGYVALIVDEHTPVHGECEFVG